MRAAKAESAVYGGLQRVYEFANRYGASVVRHPFSRGHEYGLWELAVLKYDTRGRSSLCYSTPITDDVIGSQSEWEIDALLDSIEALPGERSDG